MTDVSFIHAPRDQGRINLAEPNEVRYWAQALHVSEARLRSAVSAAGDATPAVRQYLCGDAAPADAAPDLWSPAPGVAQVQRQQA
jgi:hypothetical protein